MSKRIRKPRKIYTPEQEKFVANHINIMHVDELAAAIGKTRRSLFMYLRENGYNVENHWNLYDINPQQFLNPQVPEVAYILGLLWADGHIRSDCGGIVLDNVREDVENIEWIFYKTGKWLRYNLNRKNKKPSAQLKTYNGVITKFLIENDYGEKSVKSPNKILRKIPEKLHNYFFRGWFDGDGSISITNKHVNPKISIAGSYEQDWSAFENIADKIGFQIKIYRRIQSEKSKSSFITITSQKSQQLFLDFIYNSYENDKIGLIRKYKNFRIASEKYKNRPISNTGFIGVYLNTGKLIKKVRYYAKIKDGGSAKKQITYLGFYDTPEEAAVAYDKAAIERKGRFARTNFPIENYLTDNPCPQPVATEIPPQDCL